MEEEEEEGRKEATRDRTDVEDRRLHAHGGDNAQNVLEKIPDGGNRVDQLLNSEALGASEGLGEDETDGRAIPESCPVSAERIPPASATGLGGARRGKEVERTPLSENAIIPGARLDSKQDGAGCRERVREDQRSGGEAEVVWAEGVKTHANPSREESDAAAGADGGALRVHTGGSTDGDARGEGYADGEASSALGGLGDAHGDGGKGSPQGGPGNDHQPALEWQPRKGDLVEVERRMTPGVNKPGGTARVVKVDAAAGTVDVRYVVEGGWERGIDTVYVSPAVLDLNEKRPTLGRCRHCGSLRVDCRQACEFYTTPRSPRLLLRPPSAFDAHVLPGRSRGAAAHESESGKGSRRGKDRRRGGGRHRHRSRASDGGKVDQDRHHNKRRRRRLPEKWDEEGEPVPGDGEAVDERGDSGGGLPVESGLRSQSGSPRSSSGGTSSGNSSSTDDIIGARGRKTSVRSKQRRLRLPASESESGSDSDVELLDDYSIRRGAASRGGTHDSAGFNNGGGSGGSSDSASASERSRRLSSVGSDGASADGSEGGPGEQEGGGSPNGGVAGRGWLGDAAGAVKAGTALFLVPEGEEAAHMLPSDIPDPTRGVTDPVVLRKEFDLLLQRIAERDANKLERDVADVCR